MPQFAPRPYSEDVLVVFSDLDGTLLDPATYRWEPAGPALEALRRAGAPLVLVSSKTRAELEAWRRRLGNLHPFVVENGGAVYVPLGYFPFSLADAVERDGYQVVPLGRPYPELVRALRDAAAETGVQVVGFHQMTPGQVRRHARLSWLEARLAKQREYDEPFLIRGRTDPSPLLAAIERRGLRWTRGGRFYHILGENEKAAAVHRLICAYRNLYREIRTLGLGDGWNDVSFLKLMDIAVVVKSPAASEICAALPGARQTCQPGPQGWSQAVLEVLGAHRASQVVP